MTEYDSKPEPTELSTDPVNDLGTELGKLEWDLEPQRDLWPDISSRIRFAERAKTRGTSSGSQKPAARWAPFAIAASITLAVTSLFFSSLSMQYARDSQRNQQALIAYQTAQLSLIEEQHQMVRVQFIQLLEQGKDSLNPDFVNEIQQVLFEVDSAAAELKTAIKAQPENPEYSSMLVETYQQELKLLNQIKSQNGFSI